MARLVDLDEAEDAALTLLSAISTTCFAASLAAPYAELTVSLAVSRADFHADKTASLPAGAFFARLSTNACDHAGATCAALERPQRIRLGCWRRCCKRYGRTTALCLSRTACSWPAARTTPAAVWPKAPWPGIPDF